MPPGKLKPLELWDRTPQFIQVIIMLAAVLSAGSVILGAATWGQRVTDEHIVTVFQREAAPMQNMLQFMMQKGGMWEEYQKRQDTIACRANMMTGQPCNQGRK